MCGVAAGFNHGRRLAANVLAFQLTFMSVVIYATDALQYRNAVKVSPNILDARMSLTLPTFQFVC